MTKQLEIFKTNEEGAVAEDVVTQELKIRLEKKDDGTVRSMAKVGDLWEDPANVRLHSERNVEEITGSLKDYGQQKPIVVDSRGKVLAGNGTLRAAKSDGLKWDEIWVVVTSLEAFQAVGYAIADNRTAELGRWDDKSLAQVLRSLQDQSEGVLTGFNEAEISKLISALGPPEGGLDDLGYHGGQGDPGGEGAGLMASHVRMVQLFLNTDSFPVFQGTVERLAEEYGTDNATDTVMKALAEVYKRITGHEFTRPEPQEEPAGQGS